jgi:NAD(P)-dependent dehydrogenase (short-subunit alcohol dehydrogenase family)
MPLPRSPNVVITGAGSGFGRALALALAPRGGRLVLSDVNEATAAETAQMALSRGAKEAVSSRCDVSKLEDVERLAASCVSSGGPPVDLVVNNAGVSSGGRIGEAPIADWRWTIEIDLFGVIYGCHAFVPMLRKQGSGHFLNVASAAGLLSAPKMGAYNVAKAGVIALSETLAAELVGTNIGVTVLCPTFFQTDITKSGRFPDPKTKAIADRLVAKGKTAESIALAALKSVEANELYCVPIPDGRWLWRAKRVSPGMFAKLVGRAGRRQLGGD